MTEIPLLDLFYRLRDTGLPLTIDQYYFAVDALKKSTLAELDFISDELAVKQLFRMVWVKSKQQKELFDECWENWKQNPPSRTSESESSFSQSTSPDAGREQEQTPPEQDNQDGNLDNTAREPDGDSSERGEEEKSITRIPPRNVDVVTALKLKQSDERIKEKDYLPISRRKLQKSWDKLKPKLSENITSEIDIKATVTDIAKRGFFVKPIFTADQTKEKEVVLLIDQEGSMAPFHPLCRQLVEICKARTVCYFHNSPTDEIYYDPKCWDGKSIQSILKKFSKKNTLIIIFSDAGAARQRSVYERYEETYDFLELLIPKVKRVAWLNPLPRFRWQDNTAEEIAKISTLAPMFALVETEEREQMVQWLLDGKPSIKKFLEKANNSAKEECKKHQSDSSNLWDLEFDAKGRIEFFKQQFGEAHLHFASCGAFPLVLTPDLLYCLWSEFFRNSYSQTKKSQNSSLFEKSKQSPESSNTEKPEVPWYAVADLLLSDLCKQIYSSSDEEELYEMEREIRSELLKPSQKEFKQPTIKELSDFLIEYINLQLNKQSELYEVQQWTALAYTEPNRAAKELASKLRQAYLQSNKAELVRLSEVTEAFVEPLKDYKPLLIVARGYAATARGDEVGAKVSKVQLKKDYSSDLVNDEIAIAEVLLELPDINMIRFPMKKFSFDVVTVNRRGAIINEETKEARYFTETISPPPSSGEEEEKGEDITLDMVYIPSGKFMMGTEDEEVERLVKEYSKDYFREETPQHEVTVPAFFMGKHKITQEQWKAVAELIPKVERDLELEPSDNQGEENLPVEQVSWYEALEFCARLSKYTGRKYRLPSEAEWEYACRAGTTTPFYFGKTITGELANYRADETFAEEEPKQEFREKSNPVGKFPPNAFGLYDMHGNVNEWCLDDYHDSYEGAPTDGSAWFDDNDNNNIYQKTGKVVVRGGQFMNTPESSRSAARDYSISPKRHQTRGNIGFRVVCEVGEES